MLKELNDRSLAPPVCHVANTSAMLALDGSHLAMVRPGIALYGMVPDPSLHGRMPRRPVLSLKTRIAFLRDVKAGTKALARTIEKAAKDNGPIAPPWRCY